jgi:hypothetical protein
MTASLGVSQWSEVSWLVSGLVIVKFGSWKLVCSPQELQRLAPASKVVDMEDEKGAALETVTRRQPVNIQ